VQDQTRQAQALYVQEDRSQEIWEGQVMRSLHDSVRPRRLTVAFVAVFAVLASGASAQQVSTGPGWTIRSLAQPSNLSSAHNESCEEFGPCESYLLTVTNVGGAPSAGTVTISDTLPEGLVVQNVTARDLQRSAFEEAVAGEKVVCTTIPVRCTYAEPVPSGDSLEITIRVTVSGGGPSSDFNHAQVTGGGAVAASTVEPSTLPNTVNGVAPGFGVQDFSMAAFGTSGMGDSQAGDHPNAITTSFDLASDFIAEGNEEQAYAPVQDPKTLTVELPLGLIGDPLATPRCPEAQLEGSLSGHGCPADTRVGTIVVNTQGGVTYSDQTEQQETVSDIYNMVPEAGFPAEFGFRFVSADVLMFVRVVPTSTGDRVLITAPDLAHAGGLGFKIDGATLTFFGDPAKDNGGTDTSAAFLTNPTSCASGGEPLTARIEVSSWVNPQATVAKEVPVYAGITGCEALQFAPTFGLTPETTQADEPSGYNVAVGIPQAPNVAPNLATAELKSATVKLPAGIVLSPGAADGLLGCKERGPEGIELGNNDTLGPEVQEGEELGSDGLPHAARGHCPAASRLGEVKVETPLLPPHTLTGHLYLAQPQCGSEAQPACTEASATNGELFGLYLEVEGQSEGHGDGVIIKQKGSVSANPTTGQLSATFKEDPQLPFSELKIRLNGGQRAPLANPQTCGTATTTSELEPWSAPESGPNATPSSFFDVTGCANPMAFSPGFSAGTVQTLAGGFTPFTMTLTRKDGEQDLAGVSLTMPPGVAGLVSKVPLCPEPQASLGTCPEASKIGTVNAAAGAGSEPLWLYGPVYLTGPYKGAPFGLSVVVPAVAGPFNLGNVIERAAINLDPHTAQVTVTSDPLPQIRDGVPFRLKTVNVTVDRPEFMFNPTNCSQLHLTGTVSGDMPDGSAGATAPVSTPFAVAGCKNLPFKPSFSALTHANPSRNGGAYLHVVVQSGAGQANVGSVKVQLPKSLPARLSTLKLACTEAQFAADPAGCPAGSKVGSATAYTPVLPVALTGPAYFVSHGGAKFPELVLVLQGDGVTMDLAGETFISSKGITSSTFRSVPDVPITRFDLVLPAGAHSALAGNGSFCTGTMYMPTQIKGQNGAVVKQSTKIAVTGCKSAIRVVGHSVKGSHASIRVTVPSAGTLVATGGSIKRSVRGVGKAGTVTIGVTLSSHALRVLAKNLHQRVNAEVKLRFSPKHGAPLTAYVRLLMG